MEDIEQKAMFYVFDDGAEVGMKSAGAYGYLLMLASYSAAVSAVV